MTVLAKLKTMGACDPALRWVEGNPAMTLAELWESCEVGNWMLWLAGKCNAGKENSLKVAYLAADRAVRIYAADALERDGHKDRAETLRNLPEIVDDLTAAAAATAAPTAAAATASARSAAYADAADAAAYAAVAAAYAYASVYLEHKQCADDCRDRIDFDTVNDAVERWSA